MPNPINAAKNLKNILSGINTAMKARPNAGTEPGKISSIIKGTGTGIKNAAWTNRSGYGKLTTLGAIGAPIGIIVNNARNNGLFGLNNTGEYNPANLPFVTQNSLIDKQYQQGLEALNKQYDTTDVNKKINDLYTALGYGEQDIAQQAAKQMNQPLPGGMSDAEYNAAMNAAYSTPANQVAANYAAPTGTDISGMVGNSGTAATAPGDIRNLGKIGAALGKNDRYIGNTALNADQADAMAVAGDIPQAVQLMASAAILKNQMANDEAKRQAVADLFTNTQAAKLAARGQAPMKPTDLQVQAALNEFHKLKKNEQKQYIDSTFASDPTTLKSYRDKGWSDANIYVALRTGLI